MTCACGVVISAARLAALPDTTQCVTCAEATPKVVGLMVWDHKTAPTIEIGTPLATDRAGRSAHIRFNGASAGLTVDRPAPLDETVEAVLAHPSRCHPDRARVGPSGHCLECALAYQRLRVLR